MLPDFTSPVERPSRSCNLRQLTTRSSWRLSKHAFKTACKKQTFAAVGDRTPRQSLASTSLSNKGEPPFSRQLSSSNSLPPNSLQMWE